MARSSASTAASSSPARDRRVSDGRVIVVGSVNVDLVIDGERLPSPGETVVGGRFEQHDGGKGGNQAVAAARLGCPVCSSARSVTTSSARGRGGPRSRARRRLDADHDRGTRDRRRTDPRRTIDGENMISVAPGANAGWIRRPWRPRSCGSASSMATWCSSAMSRRPRPSVRPSGSGVDGGRRRSSTRPPPAGSTGTILALADVITPNRGELLTLAATDDRRSGRVADSGTRGGGRRRARRPGAARVVRGGAGRRPRSDRHARAGRGAARRRGDGHDVPSTKVEAVDTTGAGDAFNGALAAAVTEGRSIEDATRRAVVAGRSPRRGSAPARACRTATELESALAR